MTSKSNIIKAFVLLVAIAPLNAREPSASICPNLKEADVKAIAKDGKAELNGQPFALLTEEEAGNNYNGTLIGTQEALSNFLAKSQAFLTMTPYVNTHHNPFMRDPEKRHCPYMLEKGKEIAVIALVPTP